MYFELAHQGVGPQIEKFLKKALTSRRKSDDLIIYWVTFTVTFRSDKLDPIFKILKEFQEEYGLKKSPLRIICRHPKSHRYETIITKKTLEQLQKLKIEVKGLKDTENLLLDEADTDIDEDECNRGGSINIPTTYGRLHAKFIVSSLNNQSDALLLGSFNLSENSLRESCESFAKTSDRAAVQVAFEQAEQMWERADPINIDQCEEIVGPLPIVPVKGTQNILLSQEIQWIHKEPFGPLLQLLDEELQNYPSTGNNFQSQIFQHIWQQKRKFDIIYLPVGCGKTYIALRWLLQKLSDAWDPKNPKKAWYIAPNLWIQLTVREVLNSLMEKAIKLTDVQRCTIEQHFLIGRASTLSKLNDVPVAAVIDEFHNWAPNNADSYGSATYTGIVNKLRKKGVWMLGMSATPCRIDAGKFNRAVFIREWIDERNYKDEDALPLCTFTEAVNKGFVCDLEWKTIASNKQQEIIEVLQTGIVKMGDYAGIVLGEAWGVLTDSLRDVRNLVKEIIQQIASHKSRRVVIFLPPVAERLDKFVNIFQDEFQRKTNGKSFDFRSSSDQLSTTTFQDFSGDGASVENPHVLLTIDRFSEGVSVNDIDLLVMLRPTLSPRVAVQQIGRGVRLFPGKKKCIVLDAVNFKSRWDEWNDIPINSSYPENDVSDIEIESLGEMTVAAARDENRAEDISKITSLARRVVQRRLDQGGRTQVRNAFDEWPIEEIEEVSDAIDVDALGDITVAAARDENRAKDISKITGLAQRVVQRRLDQGGRTQVKNAFDEWPLDEETEEVSDAIDVDALGDMTVAAARDENRAEDISKITGLVQRVVQRRLDQGGRTQVRNAFDKWPVDAD